MRRHLFLSAVLASAAAAWGCQNTCSCYRPCALPPSVDRCDQYPVLGVLPPHPLTPQGAVPVPMTPPASVSAAAPPPPAAVPAPPTAVLAPPPAAQADVRSQESWYPASPEGVRLKPSTSAPAPTSPGTADPPTAHLFAPSTPEPPLADAGKAAQAPKPATSSDTGITPPLPVGIAGFAQVRDGVTSGRKPVLDGIDWLKAKGYRTVLHLKAPMETDSPDRAVIERHGLTYLSLDVSPETLSQRTVDAFNRIVDDPANQPVFVYDRDGALAGALWYLHFRTVEHQTDEVARLRAARLGLSENPTPAQQPLWLAIQKILSQPAR